MYSGINIMQKKELITPEPTSISTEDKRVVVESIECLVDALSVGYVKSIRGLSETSVYPVFSDPEKIRIKRKVFELMTRL